MKLWFITTWKLLSLITFLHSVYCTLGFKERNNGMATKCTTVKAVTEITRPLFIYVCVRRHEAHALYFCTTRSSSFSHIHFFFNVVTMLCLQSG